MTSRLVHTIPVAAYVGVALLTLLFSLFVGPSNQTVLPELIPVLQKKWNGQPLSTEESSNYLQFTNILFAIRLPRILLTFLIGGGLAVSGAVLQTIFRNPLVDPYVLGISPGAAVGAALAILTNVLPVQIGAFIGGILAVLITYLLTFKRSDNILSIVLSGMVVSGLFTVLLTFIQYFTNPYKLQAIIQWSVGNVHAAGKNELFSTLWLFLISFIIIYLFRWRSNLLALGDESARAVGMNPTIDKLILVAAATLLTSASVAVAGIISFYGLFMPHIVRMIHGADHTKTIPINILLGGILLVIIDAFSRSLFLFELPIGLFTMLIGGPFLLYLIHKNKLVWN